MKPLESFRIAIDGLKSNRGRSGLTILGIVIGIAAVITMISVGEGAKSMVMKQISSLGSNNIFIEPGAWSKRMERGTMMQTMMEEMEIKTLKYDDALAIEKLPNVEMVAAFVFGVDRIVYKNDSKKSTFIGITPEVQDIVDVDFAFGRGITQEDVKSMSKVAVLGHEVAGDLFGEGQDPTGKIVRIKKTNFRVVGVTKETGTQAFTNLNGSIFLPLSTTQEFLLGIDYIREIIVKVKSEDLIEQVTAEIRLLLRQRHNIHNPEGDPARDDFKIMSQKDAAEVMSSVTGIFTVLLSSIAAISLLVGGIGIMNIMLVSVTERIREIGLRKAVGARKKEILIQFLFEAVILTLTGGVLGIVLGAFLSWIISLVFVYLLQSSWGFSLPPEAILLGVGVSVAIGLGFGIYPARKAANLSPVEALRHE